MTSNLNGFDITQRYKCTVHENCLDIYADRSSRSFTDVLACCSRPALFDCDAGNTKFSILDCSILSRFKPRCAPEKTIWNFIGAITREHGCRKIWRMFGEEVKYFTLVEDPEQTLTSERSSRANCVNCIDVGSLFYFFLFHFCVFRSFASGLSWNKVLFFRYYARMKFDLSMKIQVYILYFNRRPFIERFCKETKATERWSWDKFVKLVC